MSTPEWFFPGVDDCPRCQRQTDFAFTCLGETEMWCEHCHEHHPASLISWRCTVCDYGASEQKSEARFEQVVAGLEPEQVTVCVYEQEQRKEREGEATT